MTRRPHLDERDPAEPQDWHETSSPGIRRLALDATAAAVRAARDAHTDRVTAGHVDDAQETSVTVEPTVDVAVTPGVAAP